MAHGYMATNAVQLTASTIDTTLRTLPRSDRRRDLNQRKLKSDPVVLDVEQRQSVDFAVHEVCIYRQWHLHALNVRTNHVHVVVSIGQANPARALNLSKRTQQDECDKIETGGNHIVRGRTKAVSDTYGIERSLALAIDYVINGQGGDLPEFE